MFSLDLKKITFWVRQYRNSKSNDPDPANQNSPNFISESEIFGVWFGGVVVFT